MIPSASTCLTVPTIAALEALGAASSQYTIVNVQDYGHGVGGGGTFFWNAVSTDTPDGGTIFQASGVATGRWIRQLYEGSKATPYDFGAWGDGTHDDTTALKNLMSYTSIRGVDGGACYWPAGIYAISSPLPFNCSIQGETNECVTLKPLAGFVGGSGLFDMNAGHGGQFLSQINIDLRPLGSAGAVGAFYSTSVHGGGGPAYCYFDQLSILSSSLTTYAVSMSSSGTESGAFTSSQWNIPYISAPLVISIGQNQDNISFDSPSFNYIGGTITDNPFSFTGSDILIQAPYFGIGADTPVGVPALVNIGAWPVSINGGLMETTTTTLSNATFGFQLITAGTNSNPQANFQINNMEMNVAFSGTGDRGFIKFNVPNTVNNSFKISINGLLKSSGGNSPWDTLFCIFNGASNANGPAYLSIVGCDDYGNLSLAASGGTASLGGVVVNLQGWFQGKLLNHTAPAPAAGSRFTWTWVSGANFGPA